MSIEKPVYWRGERVRVKKAAQYTENDTDVGQVGTVLTDSTHPWIVFDEPTRYDPEGKASGWGIVGWKPGHMDCINFDRLELVEPKPAPAYVPFDPLEGTEDEITTEREVDPVFLNINDDPWSRPEED
jgi:hypothetical protein